MEAEIGPIFPSSKTKLNANTVAEQQSKVSFTLTDIKGGSHQVSLK